MQPRLEPITRVVIPSIRLDAPVVPAGLEDRGHGLTWAVPARAAGHAAGTPGPGQPGNAVLLGHVASRSLGDVFRDLDRVRPGDPVRLFGAREPVDYRVAEVRSVGRADVAAVQPTGVPSVSLITCRGVWLPLAWDYTERLVVRAELAPAP